MFCIAFFRPVFKLGFWVCMTVIPVQYNITLGRDTACQTASSC